MDDDVLKPVVTDFLSRRRTLPAAASTTRSSSALHSLMEQGVISLHGRLFYLVC
jgi:hypothetical protein